MATNKVEKFLEVRNPYLQTLKHPATVMGAKIPDGSYEDSSTFSEFQRIPLNGSTGANNNFACLIGQPMINSDGSVYEWNSLCPGIYQNTPDQPPTVKKAVPAPTAGPASTKGAPATTAGTTPINYWIGLAAVSPAGGCPVDNLLYGCNGLDHVATQVIVDNYHSIRVVSAGIRVIMAVTATSANGFLTVAPIPRGRIDFWNTSALTLANVQALPGAVVTPIGAVGSGVSAVWSPADNACLEYSKTTGVEGGIIDTNDSWVWHRDLGGFMVVASGLSSNAAGMVEVVINYEALPRLNSFLITSSPSTSDPLALSSALNSMEEVPKVKKSSNGFDGVSTGEHEALDKVTLAAVKPSPMHALRAVNGEQSDSAGAIVMHSGLRLAAGAKGANGGIVKMLSKFLGGDNEGSSMIEQIMGMLIPLAEKFLPALLG